MGGPPSGSGGTGAPAAARTSFPAYAGPLKRRKMQLLQKRAQEEAQRRDQDRPSHVPASIPGPEVSMMNAEVSAEGVGEAPTAAAGNLNMLSKNSDEPENTTTAPNPGPGTGPNVVGGTGGSGSDDAVLTAPAPEARGGSDGSGSGSGSGGGDVNGGGGGGGLKGSTEDAGDRTGSDGDRVGSGERPGSDGVGGSVSDGGGHSGSGSGTSSGEKGSGAGNGSDVGSGDGSGSGRGSVSGIRPVSTHHRQEGGSEFPADPSLSNAQPGGSQLSHRMLRKFRLLRGNEDTARATGGSSTVATRMKAPQAVETPSGTSPPDQKTSAPTREFPHPRPKHPVPEPPQSEEDKDAGLVPSTSEAAPFKRARVDAQTPPAPKEEHLETKAPETRNRKVHANSVANLQRIKKCPECGHIYGNKMGGREGGTQCTTMVPVVGEDGNFLKTEHGQPVMKRCPYVFMSSAQRKVIERNSTPVTAHPPALPPAALHRHQTALKLPHPPAHPSMPTMLKGFSKMVTKLEKDLQKQGASLYLALSSPTSTTEADMTETQELVSRQTRNGSSSSFLLLRHYAGPASKAIYGASSNEDQGAVEAPLPEVLSELASSEDTPATTDDSPNDSSSPNVSDPGTFGSFDPQMAQIKNVKSLLASIGLAHYHDKLIAHGLDLPVLLQTVNKSSSGPRALASMTGIPMGAACKITQTVHVLQEARRSEAAVRSY